MKAPYPVGFIGDGYTRCVALALPSWKVQSFLPANLELAEQEVTPHGTHPVIFLFHGFVHCQFSIPTFLVPMQFNEQTFGIPFTRTRIPEFPGMFYFMPKLYLDDAWVWMVGRTFWGFNKEMAAVEIGEGSYNVTSLTGTFLASLNWEGNQQQTRPAIGGYREFDAIREMLSQPLISLWEPTRFLSFCDFDRNWNLAMVRPLTAALQVSSFYQHGFEGGSYELDGAAFPPGVLGAYELSAPWWLSLPYLPGR